MQEFTNASEAVADFQPQRLQSGVQERFGRTIKPALATFCKTTPPAPGMGPSQRIKQSDRGGKRQPTGKTPTIRLARAMWG
jgi:hypothetical protein